MSRYCLLWAAGKQATFGVCQGGCWAAVGTWDFYLTWRWAAWGLGSGTPQASGLSLQRQGRCDTYATEFDLEAEEYVPLPKGDVHKKKEIIQDVTLHDLDVANARPQVGQQQACWHRNILYAGGSRPTVSLAASS